ncbi:MAG: SsrA-binding protein SmpB [Patescibacteria group bacterium]
MKVIAQNKKVSFDYEILEKYEAGVELLGLEVKSIKNGHISIQGSFVVVRDSQLYLLNAFVPPYQPKNAPSNYNPSRTRRLLLHRFQTKKLIGKTKEKGLTLMPFKVYNKDNKIKIEVVLARPRKKIDKREKIRERDVQREIERELKERSYKQ